MNEREQAMHLADDLDLLLSDPTATPEHAVQEDKNLFTLAGRLIRQSPFTPTVIEKTKLRQQYGHLLISVSNRPSRKKRILSPLKSVLRVAVEAAILIVVIIGINFAIKDLLGISRPGDEGPALITGTPESTAFAVGTDTPSITSVVSTTPPAVAKFPVQLQTANGIRLELRGVSMLGSSLQATFCYQPPDARAWRLDEATLKTSEGETPFYPGNLDQLQPGEDGLACENFTAIQPKEGQAIIITVKRLIALRQATPDCVQVNQQLAQDYPGMSLRCNSTGGAFSWTVEKMPEGMSTAKLRRVEQTYLDYDVHSGPWSFSVNPVDVVALTNSDQPASPVVVPAACGDASRLSSDPQFSSGGMDIPAGVAGMGTFKSGPFNFTLILACDPNFSRLKLAGDEFSEINGLGIEYAIGYGGDGTVEKVEAFTGISPFIMHGSGGGSMSRGDLQIGWEGLRFPDNAKPDFRQADVRLRYQVKVRTGGGAIEGAAMVFTLQRAPEGYRPVDVTIEPLTDAERKTVESDLSAPAPYPTQAAAVEPVSPETQGLLDLLNRWQQPLLAAPGWVHLRTRTNIPGGTSLYAGLTEYNMDEWYQLDAQGMVNTMIHIDHRLDGTPLQQTVSQNGKTTNLTFGMGGDFKPYSLDLAYPVKFALKAGANLKRSEVTLDGRQVILLALPGVLTQRGAVDTTSGAWLFSETVKLQPGDNPLTGGVPETRTTLEVAERVDVLPPEAQALLGKEFSGYTPQEPYGAPAPQGYDPSGSKLSMHAVPGDSFDAPSFWYGDISADGYLLGRVNFGSIPGGSCDRSADGSKLAFDFMKSGPGGSILSQNLQWLDLRSIQNVHAPAPEITNIGMLSWSPTEEKLAFFGCRDNNTDCGLYRFDLASGKVEQLLPDVYTSWPIIWKPDGSQIAFVDTARQENRVIVVDFSSGRVVYQGPFNANAWQVPDDSPTNQWGVSFPRAQEGNACFEVK